MEKELKIRPPILEDCLTMAYIINGHARAGHMLYKSFDQLISTIRNFLVAIKNGEVEGTCGMKFWPRDGVEIISSAVRSRSHDQGIGTALNKGCIQIAKSLGFKQVFTLTKRVSFYQNLGFIEFPKEEIQEKIWNDCRLCKLQKGFTRKGIPICEEVAMRLTFK
jgi:amino-acid N-acetyltransferase